jgi:hypothetical protein
VDKTTEPLFADGVSTMVGFQSLAVEAPVLAHGPDAAG